jgi:hypothetical protein
VLSDRQRQIVVALGDTLFPSTGPDDPSGGDVLPDALEEFVPHLATERQKGLGVALTIIETAALFRYGRRFSRLPPEKRARYLDGWMRSRIKLRKIIYRGLRNTCATLYYQDPRTWPMLGYDGPPKNGAR